MDLPITRNEWVAARLREGILSGEFAPGARLKADTLAERWRVSPTPVRESFQRLAAGGLVDIDPGRGARVAQLSPKEMVEIYSIRLLLEPLALRLSLERRTPQWEREIHAAHDGSVRSPRCPNVFRFEKIHRPCTRR